MTDKQTTNTHPKRSQPDRETLLATQLRDTVERVEILEEKLAAMDKRLAAIENMLGSDNLFRPADAGRDDTYSLFTPHEE